jgi:ADP-heptose:LPS heptosyltransferase
MMARLISRLIGRDVVNRPLIVRPGGLGDLVLSQIALEHLNQNPKDFDWLIERRSEEWAKINGLRYFCYDNGIRWVKHVCGRYNTVINTEQLYGLSQAASILATASIGSTTSFATNRGAFKNKTVIYNWNDGFEVDEFAKLFANALNLPHPKRFQERGRLRSATGIPAVGIAGLQSISRSFNHDQLEKLIKQWINQSSFEIIAAPVDRDFAERLTLRFPRQCVLTSGSFAEVCERVSRAERLFAVDGGLVHVATYFGVPTTAVFTSGREKKWAPRGAGSTMIYRKDLACRPCTKFGRVPKCPYNYECKSL